MKKEHHFKDNKTIVCSKTGGEFNIILWDLVKYPLDYCPCCKKTINMLNLKTNKKEGLKE